MLTDSVALSAWQPSCEFSSFSFWVWCQIFWSWLNHHSLCSRAMKLCTTLFTRKCWWVCQVDWRFLMTDFLLCLNSMIFHTSPSAVWIFFILLYPKRVFFSYIICIVQSFVYHRPHYENLHKSSSAVWFFISLAGFHFNTLTLSHKVIRTSANLFMDCSLTWTCHMTSLTKRSSVFPWT